MDENAWLVVLGAALAIVSGFVTFLLQFLFSRANELRRIKREDMLRALEAERALVAHKNSHALELVPAIGRSWWLIRHHAPRVRVDHLSVWDADGNSRDLSGEFISGTTLEIGVGYGLGVELHKGDYFEASWTEEGAGSDAGDGTRIPDPEASYWLRTEGHRH